MKNFFKFLGIVSMALVIGFAFIACDDGLGGTTGTVPAITTAALPNGTAGVPYSQTLAATGDAPITWSIDSGALPAGLTLSTAGVIAGTPTTANTFNFTVKATNDAGSDTKALSIVIAPSSNPTKTLVSITAEYEPETAIFPDTTLETLKEGLTVTAQYSDTTSAAVTDYSLSVEDGALIEGENTVTVSYTEGGITKTADFTVTVNAAHVHSYGTWYIHTPATCTTAGEEREDCTADPPHYNERKIEIDPTAHNYTWQQTAAPTCSAAGVESQVCTYNNSHIGETRTGAAIDPNAHDYTWQETTAPTCSAAGVETEICTYNNSHTRGTRAGAAIDPTAHDWNTTFTIIAATVAQNSMKAITCKHNPSHTKDETAMNSSETGFEYATGTAGLDFTPISINGGTNNAYRVSNKNTANGTAEGAIVIPAYYRSDASSPYLPVTEIGNGTNSSSSNAFGGGVSPNMTVTGITFAEGNQLTAISDYAFNYCVNLASVTIPASVTSIGQSAFSSCSKLASVTIPASVTSIGTSAFQSCTILASVTISEGVTSIGTNAFSSCPNLTSVAIPASVTSIDQSFYNCTSLTSITVDANNPNYTSEDGILYNKDKTTLVLAPGGISGSVTIPSSVTSIGQRAFSRCASLTSVTIPNSVTSIDFQVFQDCTSLTSVTISANLTTINMYMFSGCTSLASVTIPNSVTSIGNYAFERCTSLTSVTIPASVTSIGNYAFRNCTSLASVTIPNSVTSIGDYAFSGCTSLASVTIPNSVTIIRQYAFENCSSFTAITIPASVTTTAINAFSGCTNLTSVTFESANSISVGVNPFLGDLRTKYSTGGIGTYTTTAPVTTASVWVKQ